MTRTYARVDHMTGLIIAVITAVVVAGGSAVALNQRGFSLSSLMPRNGIKVPFVAVSSPPAPINTPGEVMGIETTAAPSVGQRISGVGKVLGQLATAIGVQTVKTGETLITNVTTTPTSEKDVIDMANVVKEVSSRVESIPSNLVNQAKVEYCKQVLQAATASGTKNN